MCAQIIAPYPFINCTYNERQVLFKGIEEEIGAKHQQSTTKYTLKTNGIYLKNQIQEILENLWSEA